MKLKRSVIAVAAALAAGAAQAQVSDGVVKIGVLMPVKSWVCFSSSSNFGPGTCMSLMPMLSTPTSSISGGRAGPGPLKRTQAG